MRNPGIQLLAIAAALAAAACDSPSGGDPPRLLQLAVASGDGQADSIQAVLADSLAVRVTDEQGRPVSGVAVNWRVLTEGGGEPSSATSQTGADGRARTAWRLGTRAGAHAMEVRATVEGQAALVDTVHATATPGAAVTAAVQGDSVRAVGRTETTRVLLTGADRHGNAIAAGQVQAAWSSGSAAVATVAQDGTVTGAAPGRATVTASGSGWTLRVRVTVTGMRMAIRPAPFLVIHIHGDGARMLGAGDSVAVRRDGAWEREPGLGAMVYALGVRVLPSGEGWAVAAEGTSVSVWRSLAPGAWSRVTPPISRPEFLASAGESLFMGADDFQAYQRTGDGWTGLGHYTGVGERRLASLSASSPEEVWAGGSFSEWPNSQSSQPFLLRWRNWQWTPVEMPAGIVLQQRNGVRVVASGTGGPVHAVLQTNGDTSTTHLLRVADGVATVVPLPPSMADVPINHMSVGPDGSPCVTNFSRVACQVNGAWREHLFTDGWMSRGVPFRDAAGVVYLGVSRRVNGLDEYAVAEMELF